MGKSKKCVHDQNSGDCECDGGVLGWWDCSPWRPFVGPSGFPC